MGIFDIFRSKRVSGYEGIAEEIVWHIVKVSFDKFRERDFRDKLQFDALSQEEQDRIFNELVITGMALVYLTLEIGEDQNGNVESREVFRGIKNNVASSYVAILREKGVEDKKLLDLWYQLLAMRCEEYRKDFKDHANMFTDPRENHWVHIAAIGGTDHMCRGKGELVERLLPQIARWCGALSTEMQRIIARNTKVVGSDGKLKKIKIGDDGHIDR